jgi:hypothetical protein
MSFLDFAARMCPYWGLGALMGWAVWKSDYKDLLAFDKKAFGKFFLFMCAVTVYRYFMLKILVANGMGSHFDAVKSLPVGGVFFTPWEDACHGLPLVLLRRMIGTKKWTWPIHALAMTTVTIGFGLGHVYQGVAAAAFISLYIPFSVWFGQKRGFATLMCSHVLYDFSTIMAIRMALGL